MRILPRILYYLHRKEVVMDRLELINNLRREVEVKGKSSFPLDVFPQKVQDIILNLATYENFNIEYTASIALSAVATAIGNACQVRIKGEWKSSPSLYMMLVGRPGLGKTPPLGFIYRPIREHDERMYERFLDEWDAYERQQNTFGKKPKTDDAIEDSAIRKPKLVTTVMSDFTPEAMMNVHQNNPRGIAVVVDEILALFNSVRRYSNKNNLIEDLLTAYSGQSLKVVRKSETRPIFIKQPCINLIGSIQTNLLSEVFCKEYTANGLLDRFLFVYPEDKKISGWERGAAMSSRPNISSLWTDIINKVLELPCPVSDKGSIIQPHILNFADDAEAHFFNWYNAIIDEVNAIEDDADVESRKMKLNGNAARLALVLQVMKWAAGERHMQFVDLDSVKGAIRLIDYYENTYLRIQEHLVNDTIGETKEAWLGMLANTFTTGDAVAAGKKLEMSRRSVFYALDRLCKLQKPLLIKSKHGIYQKTLPLNNDAPCTIALSDTETTQAVTESESHSAKVQSADGNHINPKTFE